MIDIRSNGRGDDSMKSCKDQALEVLSIEDKSIARIQQIHYFTILSTKYKARVLMTVLSEIIHIQKCCFPS